MLHYEVDMSLDYRAMGLEPPAEKPTLTAFIQSPVFDNTATNAAAEKRPAVIVCPGGGYEYTSRREAEPIALSYAAAGFPTFVLNYSCAPLGWPVPCCELSKAVAYVRSIADEHHIDKDKIIVCGFSAGGHLAASLGVHHDKEVVQQYSGFPGDANQPNGMILCYPVLINGDKTHMGTKQNFLAQSPKEAEPFYGLDAHVTEKTPKTFLWHTYTDICVPVENSLQFATALRNHGVSLEMHIFPEGGHGLSLANALTAATPDQILPAVQPWMDLSITWLKNL